MKFPHLKTIKKITKMMTSNEFFELVTILIIGSVLILALTKVKS